MAKSRHYQIDEQSSFLNHKFLIADEHNNIIYKVCSKPCEFNSTLTLIDSSGQHLINICQKDPHIHLTYCIYHSENEDEPLATIQRTGLPWHHKFKIESIYGDYMIDRIHGIFDYEYILLKDMKIIAQIKRKSFESVESYSVDIDQSIEAEEDPFILSLIVVFWCAERIHYLGQSGQN